MQFANSGTTGGIWEVQPPEEAFFFGHVLVTVEDITGREEVQSRSRGVWFSSHFAGLSRIVNLKMNLLTTNLTTSR